MGDFEFSSTRGEIRNYLGEHFVDFCRDRSNGRNYIVYSQLVHHKAIAAQLAYDQAIAAQLAYDQAIAAQLAYDRNMDESLIKAIPKRIGSALEFYLNSVKTSAQGFCDSVIQILENDSEQEISDALELHYESLVHMRHLYGHVPDTSPYDGELSGGICNIEDCLRKQLIIIDCLFDFSKRPEEERTKEFLDQIGGPLDSFKEYAGRVLF